jgi:quercetin dioxygenase-like cupin family protein
MHAPNGTVLPGIEGKRGVRGIKADGSHIGADFIRMQPGSRFELHVHEGDHELYVISGAGFVHINGEDVAVRTGSLIHIPAEYPHGVWVAEHAKSPLEFCAVGHPHHSVHARDRMRLV